jgi:hypothetical protein
MIVIFPLTLALDLLEGESLIRVLVISVGCNHEGFDSHR